MKRFYKLIFPGPMFITDSEDDAILAGYVAGKAKGGNDKGGGKKKGGNCGCAALFMFLLIILLGIAIYYQI